VADPLRTARAFHLRTFGSLTLSGRDDVTVLGRHGHHRRRLALLAVLAATGDRGWSRDQLLLFFWPEASQARARHSLDQLLYALRSSLGDELFDGTDPVRLTREVVTSDVDAFTDALDRGQLEEAVNLYRGPFLGGFHLDAAPEFDQWAESERARLGRLYLGALEQLAQAAESQGDQVSALAWWRKLVEADPVSSRSAAGLIRALMNAGDHAAALQFAGHYESVVARELNTSVGPQSPVWSRKSALTHALNRLHFQITGLAAHTADPPVPIESLGRVLLDRPAIVRWWRPGSLLALTVCRGDWILVGSAPARTSAPTPASVNRRPPVRQCERRTLTTQPLADGISDEVSAALARMGTLRVIARQSSLAFREPGADTRAIAESLRVTLLLEGSFQRIGSRLRMQVRLVDAPTRTTRWAQTYEREITDVFEVQSDIATSVAREIHLQLGARGQPVKRLTQNIAAYELLPPWPGSVNLRSDSGPPGAWRSCARPSPSIPRSPRRGRPCRPTTSSSPRGRPMRSALAKWKSKPSRSLVRRSRLDPDLPQAHAGLGSALNVRFTHLRAAEASIRRAIALGGSPRVHEQLFPHTHVVRSL
jgi:TolB-like protein/DNA-binding SARP family transcriptional activator